MITRDVSQLRTVLGFSQQPSTATATGDGVEGPGMLSGKTITKCFSIFAASCGTLNGDSTLNLVMGRIIDRLGLGANYNALALSAVANIEIGTTTLDTKFAAISAWLYHSSTTCADDFDRFSTEREQARGKAFVGLGPSTTSTLASGFMATSTSVGTFGTFTATATGRAHADYNAAYDLTGANRYLRPYVLLEMYASSSGGSQATGVSVNMVFGEPDVAPRTTTSTGILITS
jgi:hypothetical protein